ncbi:glycoside hydrolase 100 family protein [Roseisolibacter agri]|uniref:Plant neutral invertase n=1 Tax=Roseisolibacter agri TaxID=2014610 RepID=A0AA37V908_9BACT|nr:glycoside hydrolase 100 family protein [Roseisolibacter agri]GLC23938.1 hypothetical protein rosag_04510 [Roseisolibacter agri]
MSEPVSDLATPFDRAVALLRALCGPDGIHASLAATANYRAVFARDAVIAGIAGLLLDDATVAGGLVRTLERLRDLQGAEGQIASNFEPRDGGPPHVSFGTLAPRLDAATWYLVGVALAARAGALDPAAFADSVRATVRLLDALEYNGRDLLYVPAGGNWADEYPYEGYILYDQVLRAWALRLLGALHGQPAWTEKAARIGRAIDARFWPGAEARRGHPVAAFSPVRTCEMFDLAACGLLGASGVADDTGSAALEWAAERFVRRGVLPPAFHPVIDESHPDWPALVRYHLYEFRNRPHEYHNGGVWPVWLGWLALAFGRAGRDDDLARLRDAVDARLAALPAFDFEEYLHGLTGAPGGTPRMAYTATGLVLLRCAGTPAQRLLDA